MKKIVKYVADDGTVFGNEQECIKYEESLHITELRDYILCFDYMGKPIYDFNWGRIKYCKVLPKLLNMSEPIQDAWIRVMDGELDECICDHEDGWYFLDDNDRWQYWSDFESEFYKIQREIDKLKTQYED